MRIANYLLHAIIGWVLAAMVGAASADVVVVVSPKCSVGALTANQAADIFLGKAREFPNGGQAIPIDQSEGSAIRDEFYSKVANKSAAQLKAYWSKIIFTGKGQPPREVADSTAVKKLVSENPNAIGYIDKTAIDSSIKTVLGN